MLSRDIGNIAAGLHDEMSDGKCMSVSLQWALIKIMKDWQRLALELESSKSDVSDMPENGFRPVIVGGTDVENLNLQEIKS